MNKVNLLKKIPLLSQLPESKLNLIGRIATIRHYPAGKLIFSENSPGNYLCLILSGRAKIYTTSGKRKKTLAILEKGEFFGEMALFGKKFRSASALAVTETSILIIKKNDFIKLLKKHSEITLDIIRTLSERLRSADKEIESLVFNSTFGRVVKTLLDLTRKYGKKIGANCYQISIPISQQDLAELAGTAREMVCRILNRLKRLQCLKYDRHILTLTNPEKLSRWVS